MEAEFQRLIKSIKLTPTQRKDAQRKYSGVCKVLHKKYYPDIKYNGNTKILIGSYGKKTNIAPPGDVDVLFRMPASEFDRYNDMAGNGQSQLLQDIREILKDSYPTTEKIKGDGKVVLAQFADGTHNVELLPAWQQNDGSFTIPNSNDGGSWERWNPVSEINFIAASSKLTGKTKTLIRLLKQWLAYCSVELKPFQIEVLVVDYLKEEYENDVNGVEYSELVVGFFKYLLSKEGQNIVLASGIVYPLGSDWVSKATSAFNRAVKANSYAEEGELTDAVEEWRKVFSDKFPHLEKSVFVLNEIERLTKLYPSEGEEFFEKKYSIPFKINEEYKVVIDNYVTEANGFRPGWLRDLMGKSNLFKFAKRVKLRFEIRENNIPLPFSVYWKIRNFGEEAKKAGDLRGEIYSGTDQRGESTAYLGTHYVECFVVKDSQCVARSILFVPVGQE